MARINSDDLQALAALQANLEGVVQDLGAQLVQRERDYKAALADAASQTLPDLTGKVLAQLERGHPRFIQDVETRSAFMHYKKILGLFKPAGYADALAALQSQMARYLESTDAFRERAAQIRKLQNVRNQTAKRLSDIRALHGKAQTAHGTQVELSPENRAQVTRLLSSAPKARAGQPYGASRSFVRNRPVVRAEGIEPIGYDDDTDLLLWLAADIPTSLRTLALDTLHGHHSAPALAPLPFAESDSAPRDACPPESRAERAEAYCAPVDDSRPAIATDDSLGYFS